MRIMLRSKIHRATVTEADLHYEGSITIDITLMKEADILVGERVQVVDHTNGARLETYAIAGKAGSGIICMNGAASRLIARGDCITIMAFEVTDKPIQAVKLLLNSQNQVAKRL